MSPPPGAFFGTTFAHLLFQTYPSSLTLPPPQPPTPSNSAPTNPITSLTKVYTPRIYGFRVSERAKSGPRMQWMRMRPRLEGEVEWPTAGGPGYRGPEDGSGPRERGGLGEDEEEEEDEGEEDEESEEEEEADEQGGMGMRGVVGSPKQGTAFAGAAGEAGAVAGSPVQPVAGRVVKGLPQPRRSLPAAEAVEAGLQATVARELAGAAQRLGLEGEARQAVVV